LHRQLYRTATWLVAALMLASVLAGILGTASATASTTYALDGYVTEPGGVTAPPVPAGVTVDLISRATGATYTTTTTGSGGQFSFTAANTGSTLGPGYWALYVPPAGNVSLGGCSHCGVVPEQQTPVYKFYNQSVLTNANDTQILTNVAILPYVTLVTGTVDLSSNPVSGVSVRLLSPEYGNLTLVSNTSNATGHYNLTVPEGGPFILQFTYSQGGNLYSNSSSLTVTSLSKVTWNPNLQTFTISGRMYSPSGNPVTTAGNATLYDPTDHYIYTDATPPGGYFSLHPYPNLSTFAAQTFNVLTAAAGFQPKNFSESVSPTSAAITKQVTLMPLTSAELGLFQTNLNFSQVSPVTGKGTLWANTSVRLGNDSVIGSLPNESVGELWAQLGLDFNNSLAFPSADLSAVETWLESQGPFFPAVQAATTVNGTGFVGPKTAQTLSDWNPTCKVTYCWPNSAASISYNWTADYQLNGTIPFDAKSYAISFNFAHPSNAADIYNYTIELPADYVLYANTTAPAQTKLVGQGPSGAWTKFTMESLVSPSASSTATFTIVREANLTANVAVTSTNVTFTSANILNSTHFNYSVVLGVGEEATFSAAPSVYPAGQNGTEFTWDWGDGSAATVVTNGSVTADHTYTSASPVVSGKVTPFAGTLTIVSSSGKTNSTTFNVSVVSSLPKAGIATNATAYENRTVANTPFLFLNWTTTVQFNATATVLQAPNALAIAHYTLKANDYNSTANFSSAKGAKADSNWTVSFGANTTNNTTGPGHGLYENLADVKINGTDSGVTGYGWAYNLTLQVWTVVGTTNSTHLIILVNDTEPPIPKITLSANGHTITNGSVVEGPAHNVLVKLNGSASVSFGNGSITNYTWYVNNTNKSFTNETLYNKIVKVTLGPKTTDYKVNLTVTDSNGVMANTTVSLEVAENTTLRPIIEVTNLTGPTTLNAGTTYTYWANVTIGGGSKSVATDVSVSFYLRSSSGTGAENFIGGAPASVVFYGYSNSTKNATVNSTPLPNTGTLPTLKYGKTVRAVLTWDPSSSGSYILYANGTSTNQFVNGSSASVASESISVRPNPTTQLLEYGGIAAGVVVVIALLILYFRRRTRRPSGTTKPSSSSKSGLERGSKSKDDDDL
jgi:hypothetical protein